MVVPTAVVGAASCVSHGWCDDNAEPRVPTRDDLVAVERIDVDQARSGVMRVRNARPNQERLVVDVEGGVISGRDVKAAREVVESAMAERDFLRLANRIIDEARDGDASLTRATRDRDRATPATRVTSTPAAAYGTASWRRIPEIAQRASAQTSFCGKEPGHRRCAGRAASSDASHGRTRRSH